LAALAIEAGHNERGSALPGGAAERGHARLSYRLHPPILEDLRLIEALKAECERFSQCPVRVNVNTRDIPDALPQDVALCLFRIAQEGLRNARHAGAGRAEICLRRLDGGLELAVKDDGAVTIARMSLPSTKLPIRNVRYTAAFGGQFGH
jgi:signal transduction histidine kinase